MANGYEALVMLTRLEQELVDAGRFDELESLGEDWQTVVAGLEDPSPADRALLEEIELNVWTTVAAARLRHEDAAHLLALLERGRPANGTRGGLPGAGHAARG